MVKITKSIFFPPKNKRLARKISIKTPGKFRKSIRELSKRGITLEEFRALNLAKIRAKVQTKRKNLSKREMNQFKAISKIRIPKPKKKKLIKKK